MSNDRIGILFVCAGNICRSPVAEGVFLHQANARGVAHRFDVESAGTGAWHVGDRPDPRSLRVAEQHGIKLPSRARQVDPGDFQRFQHIICMDHENLHNLLAVGAPREQVSLLLEYDRAASIEEVPDPYLGDEDGFTFMYRLIDSACGALLDSLESKTP